MTKAYFVEGLKAEMSRAEISHSELARRSGMTQSAISLVMNGYRNPGSDFASAMARALKLLPEEVFRAAGLLPPKPEEDEFRERIVTIVEKLPEEEKQNVLEYARLRWRIAEKRGKNDPKKCWRRVWRENSDQTHVRRCRKPCRGEFFTTLRNG
jgi:transcriptional regulator with XRE-family HTH domain